MSGSEGTVPPPTARDLVGPNPGGSLRGVSLAVRAALRPLLDEGDAVVLVGVSGGADSLALAVTAIDQCTRLGVEVHTLTVDHGLREGSAAEAAGVAELMGRLGAHADWESVEVGGPGGPEASARDARRDALLRRAGSLARSGGRRVVVLVGHTMDDQAETVLLRLARGSGAGSLRAMSDLVRLPDGTVWCRPLLGIRRADTRGACRQLGLDWVEDPTNAPDGPWRAADGGALRRAAVRSGALPALERALGQDPVPALARTARLLAADDEALSGLAEDLLERALQRAGAGPVSSGSASVSVPPPGGGSAPRPGAASVPADRPHPLPPTLLDVGVLSAAAAAVRGRALHLALVRVGGRAGDISAAQVGSVAALVEDWHGQGVLDLPGVRVRRTTRPAAAVGGAGGHRGGRRAEAPVLELTPLATGRG